MVLNREVVNAVRRSLRVAGVLSLAALAAACAADRPAQAVRSANPVTAVERPRSVAEPQMSAVEVALAGTGAAAVDGGVSLLPTAVNHDAPLTYTVKRGDTLWDISAKFLRDPWLWPEIWHVNPSIANPHLIYPGDRVALAYGMNGEPQLRLIRGDAVRVSPLIRSQALEGPIPTIPYKAIQAFLGRPGIVAAEEIRSAPQVVGMRDRHVAAGAGMQVYVKGLAAGAAGRYSIIHPGEALRDPQTGDRLGFMALYAGTAQVESAGGAELSRAYLLDSLRETLRGDLVFPEEPAQTAEDIIPRAAPAGVSGQIIGIVNGVHLVGQYNVVAVNRGADDGLQVGHVLAIDQHGETVTDPACRDKMFGSCWRHRQVQLPSERAGTLLVFKTYNRMSFGLVVEATSEMREGDGVRAP
jgi:LysM repeat protein